MSDLLFGTAGVPKSTPKSGSKAGIKRIRELGLDCMELAFVRRVSMGEKTASNVKEAAEGLRVRLSVHAPYYINLNATEVEKVKSSRLRILKASYVGWLCGAKDIVFHPAFYHDDPPDSVYERVKEHLSELSALLREEGISVVLRPETTGKLSQFGSLDEIIELSSEVEGVAPCVDFAHIHARTGRNNSYEEFVEILRAIEGKLGRNAIEEMHIHVSGIDYGKKGEKEHLNLEDSDFRYLELLQALHSFGVKGVLLCESPNLEEDALVLQEAYRLMQERT
jgi:deoxyribonuclease-4